MFNVGIPQLNNLVSNVFQQSITIETEDEHFYYESWFSKTVNENKSESFHEFFADLFIQIFIYSPYLKNWSLKLSIIHPAKI